MRFFLVETCAATMYYGTCRVTAEIVASRYGVKIIEEVCHG